MERAPSLDAVKTTDEFDLRPEDTHAPPTPMSLGPRGSSLVASRNNDQRTSCYARNGQSSEVGSHISGITVSKVLSDVPDCALSHGSLG